MSIFSPINEKVKERFWQKVDRSGGPDACWPWVGAKSGDGYGSFRFGRRSVGAHRVALIITGVDIPSGYHAAHECDNPECVNPAHLSPKTPAENLQEAFERGLVPPTERTGSKNGNARLSASDVREIRRLYATGDYTLNRLAKLYGVTLSNISCIVLKKTWTHI